MSKPNVNQVSYLPSGIVGMRLVAGAKQVELHVRYEDGSVYIAVLISASPAS